jgi:hypothetical protein
MNTSEVSLKTGRIQESLSAQLTIFRTHFK